MTITNKALADGWEIFPYQFSPMPNEWEVIYLVNNGYIRTKVGVCPRRVKPAKVSTDLSPGEPHEPAPL